VFWWLSLAVAMVVAVVVDSVVSGVRFVVVRLLASYVGVDRQSWVFALSALCFIVLSCMGRIVLGFAPNSLLY
jgi:hypothetical protein